MSPKMPDPAPPLTDNSALSRFEMVLPQGLAFVAYRLEPGRIILDHAEVPTAAEGQGAGSRLVQATLEAARARGLKVVPRCGFVQAYLRRHPEFADLLA